MEGIFQSSFAQPFLSPLVVNSWQMHAEISGAPSLTPSHRRKMYKVSRRLGESWKTPSSATYLLALYPRKGSCGLRLASISVFS